MRQADQLLRSRLADAAPFALSKCGFSEQAMLVIPSLLNSAEDLRGRALRQTLRMHAETQMGVFPGSLDHVLDVCGSLHAAYSAHDVITYADGRWVQDAMAQLPAQILSPSYASLDVRFTDHDHLVQSILCSLRGKRILLVTTPGDFLAERANAETFEKVWGKVNRQWFEPASIASVSFPFVYDPRTHAKFTNTFGLLDFILNEISSHSFDVALIGAAVLGPILASEIREQGHAAFSIGSQLQLLFGVSGRRWEAWHSDGESVITEAWTHLPESFSLATNAAAPDGGAYWL